MEYSPLVYVFVPLFPLLSILSVSLSYLHMQRVIMHRYIHMRGVFTYIQHSDIILIDVGLQTEAWQEFLATLVTQTLSIQTH